MWQQSGLKVWYLCCWFQHELPSPPSQIIDTACHSLYIILWNDEFNKTLVHHQRVLVSMTSPLNKDSEASPLNTCKMWASQHPDVTSQLPAPLHFIKASPTFLPTFSEELLILFCPSPGHLSSVLSFLLQESRWQVESVLDVSTACEKCRFYHQQSRCLFQPLLESLFSFELSGYKILPAECLCNLSKKNYVEQHQPWKMHTALQGNPNV